MKLLGRPTPRARARAARRHRARRPRAARAARAAARRATAQHRHKDVYQHSLTVLEQAIDLEHARLPGAAPDLVLRLAALLHDIGKPATRRFEGGGSVTFHHHDVVGAKLAREAAEGAALPQRARSSRSRTSSSCTSGSSATARARGPTRRCAATCATRATCCRGCTSSRAPTSRPGTARKARRLATAYDDLERRIAELARAGGARRRSGPISTARRSCAILGVTPGPEVGEAYRFLLELRLDEGPLGEEEAVRRLHEWWAARS